MAKHTGIYSPKLLTLSKRLEIAPPHAVGILAVIWQMTNELRQDSDLPGLTAAELIGELASSVDPVRLFRALVETGWLEEHPDRLYSVAGWPEKQWFNPIDYGEAADE